MNKQAIAFLSMFTLVFMLAIYYVTLEEETISVVVPSQGVQEVMQTMKQTIDEEISNEILALKTQLSEENSDKNLILQQIEKLEQNQTRQNDFEAMLNEKGYKSIIQIKNEIITIHVFESKETAEEATQIMAYIYPLIDTSELIEVSFS